MTWQGSSSSIEDKYQFPQWNDHYRLRVSLDEIEPAIERRVLVPQDMLLPRLHDVLQVVGPKI